MGKRVDVPTTLKKIKELVCIELMYDVSRTHVIGDYMTEGMSSFMDIEHCIRNATTIHAIEEDMSGEAIDGMKYTIRGFSIDGRPFYTTGIFKTNDQGQEIYYFITAHIIEKKGE